MNQFYWIQETGGQITSISKQRQDGYKLATVPNTRLAYFTKQYRRVKYDETKGVLVYPSELKKTLVDDATATKSWQDVEQLALNGVQLGTQVNNIDFTEDPSNFGIFDSYNYRLSDNGLLLDSFINHGTGAAMPARFRAFDIPFRVNQYACTTAIVPKAMLGYGLDFSYWYFNDKNKYGYRSGIQHFDTTEFDVDEIRGNKHYITIYADGFEDTYQVLPVAEGYELEYHTYAIKWTDNNLSYYIDGQLVLSKDEAINKNTMFPTWEIEVPADGLSTYIAGAVEPTLMPCQAVVKDYKVWNLEV